MLRQCPADLKPVVSNVIVQYLPSPIPDNIKQLIDSRQIRGGRGGRGGPLVTVNRLKTRKLHKQQHTQTKQNTAQVRKTRTKRDINRQKQKTRRQKQKQKTRRQKQKQKTRRQKQKQQTRTVQKGGDNVSRLVFLMVCFMGLQSVYANTCQEWRMVEQLMAFAANDAIKNAFINVLGTCVMNAAVLMNILGGVPNVTDVLNGELNPFVKMYLSRLFPHMVHEGPGNLMLSFMSDVPGTANLQINTNNPLPPDKWASTIRRQFMAWDEYQRNRRTPDRIYRKDNILIAMASWAFCDGVRTGGHAYNVLYNRTNHTLCIIDANFMPNWKTNNHNHGNDLIHAEPEFFSSQSLAKLNIHPRDDIYAAYAKLYGGSSAIEHRQLVILDEAEHSNTNNTGHLEEVITLLDLVRIQMVRMALDNDLPPNWNVSKLQLTATASSSRAIQSASVMPFQSAKRIRLVQCTNNQSHGSSTLTLRQRLLSRPLTLTNPLADATQPQTQTRAQTQIQKPHTNITDLLIANVQVKATVEAKVKVIMGVKEEKVGITENKVEATTKTVTDIFICMCVIIHGLYLVQYMPSAPLRALTTMNKYSRPKYLVRDNLELMYMVALHKTNRELANVRYGPIGTWNLVQVNRLTGLFRQYPEFNEDIWEWDVSNVTDMGSMFLVCCRFNCDLSRWNVSKVTNMSGMFNGCRQFDSDLSRWNVSKVTNMDSMFYGCRQFNSDLSKWNVSKVTDMSAMFFGCHRFTSDLSKWDVSKVTDMSGMFVGCTQFQSDLSQWPINTSQCLTRFMFTRSGQPHWEYDFRMFRRVKYAPISSKEELMTAIQMYYGNNVGEKNHIVNKYGLINEWDVSSVTDMSEVFSGHPISDDLLFGWDVRQVTDMSDMFMGCSAFEGNGLDEWEVDQVTNMSHMFDGCTMLVAQLEEWKVDQVTNMSHMFDGCTMLSAQLDEWNVHRVTNMSYMFGECSLFNGNLSRWNVGRVTDMIGMFMGCSLFASDVSEWQVGQVTDMSSMFAACQTFNSKLAWDVSNVTDMSSMFEGCIAFNQDLTWDVSRVTNMSHMFYGCVLFNGVLSTTTADTKCGWTVHQVTDMSHMFENTSMDPYTLASWEISAVSDVTDMFAKPIAPDIPPMDIASPDIQPMDLD